MKRFLSLTSTALFAGVLSSCAADKSRSNACPPVTILADTNGWQLAAATYTARQESGAVMVTATGATPTAGFRMELVRHPMKIFPPKFELWRKPPDGIAAQVITPFTVCVTFKANPRVEAVTVRDAKGEHRIIVETVQ